MGRLTKVGSIKEKSILDSWKEWSLHGKFMFMPLRHRIVKIKIDMLTATSLTAAMLEDHFPVSSIFASLLKICERQQVLSELTSTLKQVDKVNEQLTKSNKRLSSEVVAQGNSKKRRRSDITTVSRQQQWFRRKHIQSDIQQPLLEPT